MLDGAAIVRALPTSSAFTGHTLDNALRTDILWDGHTLDNVLRTDIVWGDYRPASLKESTRNKRDKGSRKKVAANVKISRNLKAFLEDSSKKMELFALLTAEISSTIFPDDKLVIINSAKYHI